MTEKEHLITQAQILALALDHAIAALRVTDVPIKLINDLETIVRNVRCNLVNER